MTDSHICEQQILEDKNLSIIANYLKEELNRVNPEQQFIIVNTTRNFDAYNIPVQDFPCLKVYRTASRYLPSNKRVSNCQIQYGLVLPDQERLLPYLNWVDYQINKALSQSKWVMQYPMFIEPSSKSCEYRSLLSELGIPVYSFLRFNFTLTEGTL